MPLRHAAAGYGHREAQEFGWAVSQPLVVPASAVHGEQARGPARAAPHQEGSDTGWQCGTSPIRASTIEWPRADKHGSGRLRGVMRDGSRLRTVPTRSPCWRSRTSPARRTWCRCATARMMISPFTFYRGAAKIMAADLKDTPVAGLDVQLCGDAQRPGLEALPPDPRDPDLIRA